MTILYLFQENYITNAKGSQAEEQDSCQVRREAGEDVSLESRFMDFLVTLSLFACVSHINIYGMVL